MSRKMEISTANSVKTKVWKKEKVSWPEFAVNAYEDMKIIPYDVKEYQALPDDKQREVKSGAAYVFGALDQTGFRQRDHIVSREGLTYDLDDITKNQFDVIRKALNGSRVNYLLHSTASYDGVKPKARVIIPFSKPVSPDRYLILAKGACSLFNIPLDDDVCSYEATHAMFFPARLQDVEPIFDCIADEKFLDPDTIPAYMPNKAEPQQKKSAADNNPPPYDREVLIRAMDLIPSGPYHPWIQVGQILKTEDFGLDVWERWSMKSSKYKPGECSKKWDSFSLDGGLRGGTLIALARQYSTNADEYIYQKRSDHEVDRELGRELEWDGVLDDQHPEEKKAIKRLFDSAETLQSEWIPPIPFIIPRMLPQGIGFKAGVPKVGKSFLSLGMSYSVAGGIPFLGYQTVQAPVIYYSLEMERNLIQSRLKLMYPGEDWPANLKIGYNLPSFENGLIQTLEADIKHFDAKLITIDTFAFVSKVKSTQRPLYEETYKEIKELKDLADRLGVTIILVSHLNKNSLQADDFDRMMGSVANRGASDFNMILARDPDNKGQCLFKMESRKSTGFDLVLQMNSDGTFTNLGSQDELKAINERDEYRADPVVATVINLVMSQAIVEIKATELYELIPDYAKAEITSVNKLGNRLNKLTYRLKKYDRITFEKARKEGGMYYAFNRPKSTISFTKSTYEEPMSTSEHEKEDSK